MPRETRLGTWAQEAETPKPDEGLSGQRIVTLTALPPKDVAAMAAVVGAARALQDILGQPDPCPSCHSYWSAEVMVHQGGCERRSLCDALAAWDALEEAK